MSAPSEIESVAGWLYDGQSATRHSVRVTVDGDLLRIEGHPPVAIDLLKANDGGPHVYARTDLPGWRLGLEAPDSAMIALLPRATVYGGVIDRFGLWWMAGIFAALSVLTIVGTVYGIDLVARLIPYSWEQRFGSAMTGDFGEYVCADPAGQQALDSLARRLSPASRPIRIHMVNVPVVNAVALPGGQILIFRKLVEEAQSPDELAGVLAHEIGHVEHRHVMVALLRRFGLAMLLGSGGAPTEYAQSLLDARYSQAAEREADTYSIDQLHAAHISPLSTAAFFARLSRGDASGIGVLAYFASHPPSAERRRRFEAAAREDGRPSPALDMAQWRAVRKMCGDREPQILSHFRF